MSTYVVVGLQYGDEGKGKITDVLSAKSDYVVRYQGGNNAGIDTIWYNPHHLENKTQAHPTYEVDSYQALLEILDKL